MIKKLKKIAPLTSPSAIEIQYQTKIRSTLSKAADLVRTIMVPNLPKLVSDNKLLRGDSQNMDQQPTGEIIASLYESINLGFDAEFSPADFELMAQSVALETSTWNKNKIHTMFKTTLGINLIQGEPWLAEMLQIFALNNANLIKNVSTTFIDQTAELVNRGLINGWRHEVIAQKMLGTGKDELGKVSRFRMAKTRANLIARDQVNKLNGNLTHLRQTDAGVTHYFWRDSNDTRVRLTHRAFDNFRFSWKKGADGGIHPGDEIQCRCWAEPDFSTVGIGNQIRPDF